MRKADNLPPSCAVVTKSGNLNFLKTLWVCPDLQWDCFTFLLFSWVVVVVVVVVTIVAVLATVCVSSNSVSNSSSSSSNNC